MSRVAGIGVARGDRQGKFPMKLLSINSFRDDEYHIENYKTLKQSKALSHIVKKILQSALWNYTWDIFDSHNDSVHKACVHEGSRN